MFLNVSDRFEIPTDATLINTCNKAYDFVGLIVSFRHDSCRLFDDEDLSYKITWYEAQKQICGIALRRYNQGRSV